MSSDSEKAIINSGTNNSGPKNDDIVNLTKSCETTGLATTNNFPSALYSYYGQVSRLAINIQIYEPIIGRVLGM